ncbi:hypothetical protein V8B55DRAFT_1511881 [Mucor lusitanicus]
MSYLLSMILIICYNNQSQAKLLTLLPLYCNAKLYCHIYCLYSIYKTLQYFYQCGLLFIQIKTKSKSIQNHKHINNQ